MPSEILWNIFFFVPYCCLQRKSGGIAREGSAQHIWRDITGESSGYLGFLIFTPGWISRLWPLSLSRSIPFLKVQHTGGNIWAIKCQMAFQTSSSFQPHQEDCLKIQSAFALTKYIYNYLLLKNFPGEHIIKGTFRVISRLFASNPLKTSFVATVYLSFFPPLNIL